MGRANPLPVRCDGPETAAVADESSWRVFDRIAGDYDDVLPFFREVGERFVAALELAPGTRFLDLGAGRGALTGPALRAGCAVTAIDAAPAMVARLRAAFPAADARVMDAHRLDLPDASIDVVGSTFVLHVLDDPVAAAGEAFRVLAPGGRIAVSAGAAVRSPPSARRRRTPSRARWTGCSPGSPSSCRRTAGWVRPSTSAACWRPPDSPVRPRGTWRSRFRCRTARRCGGGLCPTATARSSTTCPARRGASSAAASSHCRTRWAAGPCCSARSTSSSARSHVMGERLVLPERQ
ncbi:class I SAM-dependent methyltransferase [Jiangella rhizosphaerae]|uniref:Class I SAM-dependent methyltransferase n=1 Tax=Jiangella rhizosphaerae TaxID=2293569 RepID=A0A418KLR5_9ACTN|nr:class I SAM-dependent methyltransferase [Jiangella rhizosphaerae]